MAITYSKPVRVDELSWRQDFTTSATLPATLRVYREGVLIETYTTQTAASFYRFTVMPGEFPFIEVLDKDCAPTNAFSGRFTMYWYATGNLEYRIEKYISAVWTAQATIPDNGMGHYVWRSQWLDDTTTHQFRVVPVGTSGNDGTALTLTGFIVRHPDVPSGTVTYNGAGPKTLTIAAA